MRSPSPVRPVRMARVGILAPDDAMRDALARVADEGVVELDPVGSGEDTAAGRLERRTTGVVPALAARSPDLETLEAQERWELLAGEMALRRRLSAAAEHGPVRALMGWAPTDAVAELQDRLATVGGVVVVVPHPPGLAPPTLLHESAGERAFRPLVETYGTVPYADVDPTSFAALSYVLMFGMMFGDVGHGLVLAVLGAVLGLRPPPRFRGIRHLWPLVVACGLAGAVFGWLYGEAFGPTAVVSAAWFEPLDDPIRLLVAAGLVGAALVGVSYVLGTLNRWREAGPGAAVVAASGLAGLILYLALGLLVLGVFWDVTWLLTLGWVLGLIGLVLILVGLLLRPEDGSRGARVAGAVVELFDAVVRIGTNAISFTRLAAFGLTHAAIGSVVWSATTAAWGAGLAGRIGAVVVFAVGNALAFALEALVVGVQALRLEYYELFSRILVAEGRPFAPWHVPIQPEERS